MQDNIILFLDKRIRAVWCGGKRGWMFSVADLIAALTGSSNPRRYWSDLKRKMKNSGDFKRVNIVRFKLKSKDGKYRMSDIADSYGLMRIIEAAPSRNAAGVKLWLKSVGLNRIETVHEALIPLIKHNAANRLLLKNAGTPPSLCEIEDDGKTADVSGETSENQTAAAIQTLINVIYMPPRPKHRDAENERRHIYGIAPRASPAA